MTATRERPSSTGAAGPVRISKPVRRRSIPLLDLYQTAVGKKDPPQSHRIDEKNGQNQESEIPQFARQVYRRVVISGSGQPGEH